MASGSKRKVERRLADLGYAVNPGKRARRPVGIQPPHGVNSDVPFASFEESSRTVLTIASNGAMTLDEFRVLCYGAGRAMLWMVVIFALWSMYDYFTKFYGKVRDRIEVRQRRRSRILRRRRRKAAATVLGSTRGEGVKG